MVAEENAFRSDRDSSPDLCCPESPVWSGDGFEGERIESAQPWRNTNTTSTTSPLKSLGRTGQVISLFLEDWEVGRVALSCHLSMDPSCQEMRDACRGELRFSGFSSFLVFGVTEKKEEAF